MTPATQWPVKMKLSLAAKFLGISSSTLSNMINSGRIKYENDPLDNRVKLVKRADLEALLQKRTKI
jgi:predicted site-specific integrase-resolvase